MAIIQWGVTPLCNTGKGREELLLLLPLLPIAITWVSLPMYNLLLPAIFINDLFKNKASGFIQRLYSMKG